MERESQVYSNILKTIGDTPLVRLNRIAEAFAPLILAKVESFNPGGSVKDRIGIHMIEKAEAAGLLKPGGTIVESTSGNTGCGLALAAAVKGYKAIFTMPDKMSREKVNLLKAYGAKVIVTPTAVAPDSPESYYEVAKRIVRETPGAFHTNQYFNPDNPEIHELTTGPEIWRQSEGRVTHLVAGMGTGGTISGTGRYLKRMNEKIRVVGADPVGSILKEQFETGHHAPAKGYLVEGIGEDMLPGTLDFSVLDEIIQIDDPESFQTARRLAREEGILSGGSAGTAVAASFRLAERLDANQTVVVLIPDTGERYLSKVHNEEWLQDNRMIAPVAVSAADLLKQKGSPLPGLVTVNAKDPLKDAVRLIRTHNISQLPVCDADGSVSGTLLEAKLMEWLLDGSISLDDPVSRAAAPRLPCIAADAPIAEVMKRLAKEAPAVLVEEGTSVLGILTRFDLIEHIAE